MLCGKIELSEGVSCCEACSKKERESEVVYKNNGFSEEEWLKIQKGSFIEDKGTSNERLTGGVIERNIGNFKVIERICIRGNNNEEAVTEKLIFEVPGKKPFFSTIFFPEISN